MILWLLNGMWFKCGTSHVFTAFCGFTLNTYARFLKDLYSVFLFVDLCIVGLIQEHVTIEDLNNDVDRRNLDFGLPETLDFNIKRSWHSDIKLRLTENKRLNANAPLYEVEMHGGKQKLVAKKTSSIHVSSFWPLHIFALYVLTMLYSEYKIGVFAHVYPARLKT